MRKVLCVHLYNDYSGSPLVLSTVIKGLLKEKIAVEVLTSSDKGFLTMPGVRQIYNQYQFRENKYLRLLTFLYSQICMFFIIAKFRKEDVVIYVNTLLPFAAALAGKLFEKKVVYHIHETTVNPPVLKKFLKYIAAVTASEVIYVSHYLKEKEGIKEVPATVIYNALSKAFIEQANQLKVKKNQGRYIVLMICSLKDYKGVREFVSLAKALPDLLFELVLNADDAAIGQFFNATKLPTNLKIFPKQSNVHPFYERAKLVVNLSHPEKWVETFGMTLLEGMQYGIPGIAPPVGGCTEVIEDGVNGYQIDQRNQDEMVQRIAELAEDAALSKELSLNAKRMAEQFSVNKMQEAVVNIIQGR